MNIDIANPKITTTSVNSGATSGTKTVPEDSPKFSEELNALSKKEESKEVEKNETEEKSEKIEETRKKALIYNAGISTALSIISGYIFDRLLDKPAEKFIENFKKANRGMPNLEKQVEGIKIAKPILIVGGIYYMIIPFISTFLADIADHNPKLDIPHKKNNKCKQI